MKKIHLIALGLINLFFGGCATSTTEVTPPRSRPLSADGGNAVAPQLGSIPEVATPQPSPVMAKIGKTEDARMVAKLIGTWTPDPREKEFMDGVTTYRADGTGTDLMWPVGHPDRQIRIEFTWHLVGEVLTVRPTSANTPPTLPLPSQIVDRVVSITDTTLVFELLDGYADPKLKGKRTLKIRKS